MFQSVPWVASGVLAIVGAAPAVAGQEGSVAPSTEVDAKKPRRVLVYTVSAGFEHEVAKRAKPDELCIVERALVDLGKKSGWFEAVPSRDAQEFEAERLAKFDLVFFYTTGELPLTKGQRNALFEFVKQGGAFAGSHCATDTFYQVPEYGEMIGAYFDGHPWHEKVGIRVEDREHPATRHLGPKFEIVDEIYQHKAPYDRTKLHVLLSLDTSATDMKKEGIHRSDGDFAIAWCKEYGKGRVFHTAFGHRPEVWKDERFLQHVAGGFAWTMRMPDEPTKGPMWRRTAEEKEKPKDSGGKDGEKKDGEKKDGEKKDETPRLPLVPDGFAVDLIAEAPEILWPSAVTCLSDGSLLVGEDRMDMPGPVDQPVDRVIRLAWKSDGTFEKTAFAEKLYAVMGLAEVDDDVYVMNMPHLTRLRDADGDGVAEERQEVLTDLGPPAPGFDGPGRFNDHIVSGMRLGMDGFLYIAVGDKGIPGAHGTDGSTIQLRGGGVVRVRPDGSRLEIVASGLRNILDVAIDERGEMFTYDNTDDGLGWWTRLTHIVVGGYYGYPWDYKEHLERMLPCMAEYGGGSPTGGMVYREAAWPEPYQGSLFFCEWGKSALRRFEVEPDGATFKVAKDEDFMRAGDVKVFKPFDVCESPDGRFLYVSDWAYEGWTNPKEAGRLWRIRRADDDARVPSVARPLPTDVDGLIAALDDPSFNHRLRAQRALSRRGTEALQKVGEVLRSSTSERTARHALWALAAIDQFELGSVAGTVRSGRAESDLTAQYIRAVGLDERPLDVDVLDWIDNSSPVVRREVASAIESSYRNHRAGLRRYRGSREEGGLRHAIAGGVSHLAGQRAKALAPALVRNEDPVVLFLMRRALKELPVHLRTDLRRPEIVARYLPAIRDVYHPRAVEALEAVLESELAPSMRAQAVALLGGIHRKPEPWDGKWWSIQPAKTPRPAKTVEWSETARILSTVRTSLSDGAPEVRRAALEAVRDMPDRAALGEIRERWSRETDAGLRLLVLDVLGELKDEQARDLLASIVRDPGASDDLRQRAIDTACAIRTPEMVDLLCSVAEDAKALPEHVTPCLKALGKLKEVRTAPAVARRLGPGPEEVRLAAASALVDIHGEKAASDLEPLLRDPSLEVRRGALKAFAKLKLATYAPKLLPLVDDEATRDQAILALAAAPDRGALSAYLLGLVRKNVAVQEASRTAIAAVREDVRGDLEALHSKGQLDDVQLAAVQGAYREPQPILDWWIAGPLKRATDLIPAKTPPESQTRWQLEQADLEPLVAGSVILEAQGRAGKPREAPAPDDILRVDPLAGVRFVSHLGDAKRIEHLAEPKNGFVDLEKLLSKDPEVAAYAYAEVVSSRDREADMAVGSDDMVTVWVNGEKVHDYQGNRALTIDEDRFKVKLKAGENTILLRVGNGVGQWSFNAKISGDPTGPLFEKKVSLPGVDEYRAFALENKGNPARGFKVFRDSSQGAMCVRCHVIFGAGTQVGPDLSDFAAKYSREEIIASVLEPSLRIAEGYRSSSLELDSGVLLFGMIKKETASAIEFFDTNGELHEIDKSEIESRGELDTSVMPDGLALTLTKEDFADLIGYLCTLRGAPGGKK